jgi:ABC-2 type transport system permease protein
MSCGRGAPRDGWADVAATGLVAFGQHVWAVTDSEIRKLRHDPWELATRAVQPILWLMVFGHVMARVRGMPTGELSYLEFMTPGILAQSVLFVAIFYGISVIWERDLGILQKYLVSPASRTALVLGKGLSAGVRAISGAVIVYVLTLVMDIRTNVHPLAILGVLGLIVLGSAVFATLSLIMACIVKTRERFMGMGQVMTMPIFFASNAIYPLSLMPDWLRVVSRVNPLTYQVDALRALMLPGGVSQFGLGVDVSVLLGALVALVWTAARLYPRMVT